MQLRLLIAAAAAPFLLAACGGNDDSADRETPAPEQSSTATESPSDSTESPTDSAGDDEAAIEETMTAFLLEPRCDLATDEYLTERSLFDEKDPAKACDELEASFVEPQFTADDIVYSDLEIKGDVATIEVGSDLINITTEYELTKVDGTWLVSGDEYNSDL